MNVLITGKNSYIGKHINDHLIRCGHTVDEADTMGDEWQHIAYDRYDAVIHVAAIVHEDAKTASEDLFTKVNTALPVAIATLAKNSGVRQFVFISTMAVFGTDKTLDAQTCRIGSDTPKTPVSLYGKSKWAAEQQLETLADDGFQVAVVRPPNVYGPDCKGNYVYLLKKLSKLMRICPKAYTDVRQSMLYIDNLSELIRLVVEDGRGGVFMPQDDHIPNMVDLITAIRGISGKKTACSTILGGCVKLFRVIPVVKKLYGGVYYDTQVSDAFDNAYQIVSFEKGMELTYRDMP